MKRFTLTELSSKRPRIFTIHPGTDGTESTFDIVYRPLGTTIAAVPYWHAAPQARQTAKQLVRALQALHDNGGYVYQSAWSQCGALIDARSDVTTYDELSASQRDSEREITEAMRSELPPDPEEMNDRRAHWAGIAIQAYRKVPRTDAEDALSDLLTDLMHWADRFGKDFDAAIMRACDYYIAETGGGQT